MSELPNGWVTASFGAVLESITNGIGGVQNKEGVGLPVSRIETIAEQSIDYNRIGYMASYDHTKADKYSLRDGDILFSNINSPAHIGKTVIFQGFRPLYHGVNLLRIVVNRDAVDPRYFNYVCRLTRARGDFALRAQHAVNQSSLNQRKLAEFFIPLAPLNEQKRIVDKLDAILARVDACRERLTVFLPSSNASANPSSPLPPPAS